MDERFRRSIHLRWSDLDPNFHVRHSCYYDFGAQVRMQVLEGMGLTLEVMKEQGFGPVLFREECVFKREIRFGDKLALTVRVRRQRQDLSRWSFQHEFVREDGNVCAILTVDGAWMDMRTRKLTVPPAIASEVMGQVPRTEDFEWMP
jgi:acyl-CoA thioester hydrolase